MNSFSANVQLSNTKQLNIRSKTRSIHRSKQLWTILSDYVAENFKRKGFFLLLDMLQQSRIPYSATLHHGVLIKSKLKLKSPIVHVIRHPKVSMKFFNNGKVNSDNYFKFLRIVEQQQNKQGDFDIGRSTKYSATVEVANSSSAEGGNAVQSVEQLHRSFFLVCYDRNRSISMWDYPQATSLSQPLLTSKYDNDMHEFVFLPKFGIYAACSLDRVIRFFDPSFEYLNQFSTSYTVSHLQVTSRNELITAGECYASVWNLACVVHRGQMTIHASINLQITLSISEKLWIARIYVAENLNRLYVMTDTSILVQYC